MAKNNSDPTNTYKDDPRYKKILNEVTSGREKNIDGREKIVNDLGYDSRYQKIIDAEIAEWERVNGSRWEAPNREKQEFTDFVKGFSPGPDGTRKTLEYRAADTFSSTYKNDYKRLVEERARELYEYKYPQTSTPQASDHPDKQDAEKELKDLDTDKVENTAVFEEPEKPSTPTPPVETQDEEITAKESTPQTEKEQPEKTEEIKVDEPEKPSTPTPPVETQDEKINVKDQKTTLKTDGFPESEKTTIYQKSTIPVSPKKTSPSGSMSEKTIYSGSEQKTGFYETAMKKEAAAISKIDKLAGKIPENIPVVSGFAKFKTKELEAIHVLSTGIDPATGNKLNPKERVVKWAEYEASSIRHGLNSVADILTLSGGGDSIKIAKTIGGFSKKNGPELLVDNAPGFFSRMAVSTKDLQIKNFFETTAQSLASLVSHPTGRQALLEHVKGWNVWDTVDTELKTKEGLERTLVNAQNNVQTLEVWGGSPPDTLGNLVFTLRPTLTPARGRKTAKPNPKASDFRKQMATAGFLALNASTIESLKKQGHLPPDYRNAHLNFAIKAFMKGVEGGDLDKKIDNVNYLNKEQTQSLRNIAHHLAALEIAFPTEAKAFRMENQNPQVEISRQSASIPLQPNQMGFEIKDNILNPILDKITGRISAPLQTKAKNLIIKGLGKGGAKLVGKQLAIKAGIAAGRKALLAAISTAIPGLGPIAAFLVDQALKILGKVLGKVAQNLKKGAKNLAMVGAGTLALGIMSGSTGLIAAGAGMTSVAAAAGGLPQVFAGVSQAGHALVYFFTSAVIPSIAIPAVLAAIAIPIVAALIVFIINAGAYVVPYGGFGPQPGTLESPYIRVEKVPEPTVSGRCRVDSGNRFRVICENEELPTTIRYTVTVTALMGSLTNITFNNECNVVRDGGIPPCNMPTPEAPDLISPVNAFTFVYESEYNSSFTDSFVIDNFTVTADVESEGVTQTSAAGSATIRIGDPPESCPSLWPTRTGYITQGAYAQGCSHVSMEALDVGVGVGTPVFATHTGVAQVLTDPCLGPVYVEISANCGGVDFISQYAHLISSSVVSGQTVTMGQQIGLSGGARGTSTCTTGPHLHYRFKYPSGGNPRYPGNPPFMWTPYLPVNIPRGCCGTTNGISCSCSDINTCNP